MAAHSTDESYFEKERNKLSDEITRGFEELLSSSNVLNRRLEEALGMTREYETIASLWNSFHQLVRGFDDTEVSIEHTPGMPGTGGTRLQKVAEGNQDNITPNSTQIDVDGANR